MIKLNDAIAPTPATLVQLANWQAEIAGTYDEQIALAKTHFKNKNHNKNATFNDVKKHLRKCVRAQNDAVIAKIPPQTR